MYANILIPTDGSPLAGQAVETGVALAKALGSRVTVMTVVEPFDVMEHFTTDDHVRLAGQAASASRHGALPAEAAPGVSASDISTMPPAASSGSATATSVRSCSPSSTRGTSLPKG